MKKLSFLYLASFKKITILTPPNTTSHENTISNKVVGILVSSAFILKPSVFINSQRGNLNYSKNIMEIRLGIIKPFAHANIHCFKK